MERIRGIAYDWPTKVAANGSVEVDVGNLDSSAVYSAIKSALHFHVTRFRSQGKKAMRLKLPSRHYDKILILALQAGFTILEHTATHMILFLGIEEEEPSTRPANASNEVGAGTCVRSYATMQQANAEVLNVIEPANPETRTNPAPKRRRGPNSTHLQKRFVLENKLHYQLHLETCKRQGKWFDFVSKSFLDKHHVNISPRRWQDLMDTVRKEYIAIRAYQKWVQSGATACDSYWNLSQVGRTFARSIGYKNLPDIFDQEMYGLMETLFPEENSQETRGRQAVAHGESSSVATVSDPQSGPLAGNEFQVSTESPLPFNDIPPASPGSQRLEGGRLDLPVDLLLQRSTPTGSYEDKIRNWIDQSVKEQIELRSADKLKLLEDEDALQNRIATVVKKKVEDAIQPLLFAVQKWREDEKKHQDEMSATQADQLAVMRQELELQRIIFANSMGNVDPQGTQDGVASSGGHELNDFQFSDEAIDLQTYENWQTRKDF